MFDSETIKSVADMTRVQAGVCGDAVALQFAERHTSYKELDDRTSQVANGLIALCVAPGARVGFLGKNSDFFFEILLGAAKARAALAPVNWRLAEPEIVQILNDSGCSVLFVDASFLGVALVAAARCPAIRNIVVLGRKEGDFVDYETWRDGASRSDPQLSAKPDDDVVLLYTSGTTGLPKGVQLTNENIRVQLRLASQIGACDYAPGETSLVVMPVFHIAGVNMGLFALSQGVKAIVMSEVDPQAILRLIEDEHIAYAFIVPAVILSLLQQPNAKTTDYKNLKLITYGASPIAEHVLSEARKTMGCGFLQLYGLTETTGGVCYLPPQDHEIGSKRLRSCGIPYPETQIRVVGARGESLGSGEVGEIVVRSPVVMKGYWNKPEETARAIEGGWFHTGDAGYFDEDGYLYIHDRIKDMIVSGGENVYPTEVENALFGHPAIADVAVIGVPDEKWGEAVKAIVVFKPGIAATPEELSAFIRKSIAGYKIPKSFEIVAVLPRNPSGKILRRDLRAPYWRGRDRQIA